MSRFRITKEKYDDMKRGIKYPLGFIRLVGKVVEFQIVDDPKFVVKGNTVRTFDPSVKQTGMVKMIDEMMLKAAIFTTSNSYFSEGEVDVNSIRVLPLEESIIWKLTNE